MNEARRKRATELIVNSGPRYRESGWPFWDKKFGPARAMAFGYYDGYDANVWQHFFNEADKPHSITIKTKHKDEVYLRTLDNVNDDIAYFDGQEESRNFITEHNNMTLKSLEDVQKARLNPEGALRMGIWHGDEFVGFIKAIPINKGKDVEIGYWLRESQTGNGFMGAAVAALSEHLAEQNYRKIFAIVNSKNKASMNVLRNNGYKAAELIHDEEYGNHFVYRYTKN
jgi:RimJ/RimL family protein N-acetyltransferase